MRGAHHPDVPHVVDRSLAFRGFEGAVEHGQVLFLEEGRPLDGFVLVDVMNDRLDFRPRVTEPLERYRNSAVDDLHQTAAHQLLVFHQRDIGLHARGVAVHHEADGAGRRKHGRLRVAVAEVLAQLNRFLPRLLRRAIQIGRHEFRIDLAHGVAVLAHHAEKRVAVPVVAGKRPAVIARDPRRLRVRFTCHHGRDGGRIGASLVAVVRQTARHQQRAEIRVSEAERPVVVAVLLDRLCRVARVRDDDLLSGDHHAARGFERRRRRTRHLP